MPKSVPPHRSVPPARNTVVTRTAVILLLAACVGCSSVSMPDFSDFRLPRPGIPSVFKIGIQQGNVITQRMVDQLEPGMTYAQVEYVLGEPVLRNTFEQDRWDYYFSVSIGDEILQRNTLTVYFEEGRLAWFEGDLVPSADAGTDEIAGTDEDPAATDGAETDPDGSDPAARTEG